MRILEFQKVYPRIGAPNDWRQRDSLKLRQVNPITWVLVAVVVWGGLVWWLAR